MDAKMQSSTIQIGQYPTWDYVVESGIVPILENEQEKSQNATVAAFIQIGTIPQLPTYGNPWVEYFMGEAPFSAVDGAIKSNLTAAGLIDYYPTYDLVDGNLVARIGK
jgi:hypothetical protein